MSQPPSHRGAPTRPSEQLLRSARNDHAASSADRERVRRALAQRLAESADTLPDTSVSPPRGLLHPLAKTGIGLVLLAAGITTLMRSNDQPKSVAVKPPASAEVQPGEPTGSSQLPPPAASAGGAVEPSEAARERIVASAKRAAPRSKAAPRASAAPEAARVPAANSVSVKAAERTERADAQTGTQPAASRVSLAEHTERAANPSSPAAANLQPRVHESKPATRAQDESADGREELVFLTRIRAELNEKEHEQVLALCDEHERRWPHGVFEQEREGLRAMAMCETESGKAVNNARAFFASYPQSPMAPRVRAACALQLRAAALRKAR